MLMNPLPSSILPLSSKVGVRPRRWFASMEPRWGKGTVETGFIDTLSGTDLVLWLRKTAITPVHVSLTTKK